MEARVAVIIDYTEWARVMVRRFTERQQADVRRRAGIIIFPGVRRQRYEGVAARAAHPAPRAPEGCEKHRPSGPVNS